MEHITEEAIKLANYQILTSKTNIQTLFIKIQPFQKQTHATQNYPFIFVFLMVSPFIHTWKLRPQVSLYSKNTQTYLLLPKASTSSFWFIPPAS